MEIGNNFEWSVALDESNLHVEGAHVYAEDGFGRGAGERGSKEQERIEHFHYRVACAVLCIVSMGWKHYYERLTIEML